MVDTLVEWAGFACLIGFAYLCWPPAALLVAGLVFLLVSNARAARKDPNRPRLAERVARALAAYRGSA